MRNSDSRRVCQICEWTFSDDCDQQDSKMRLTCLPRWEKFLEIFSRGARPCHRFCGRPRKGAESSRSAPKPTNNRLICFFYNLYLCPRSPLISVPKITLVSGTLFIIFDNTVTVRLTILTEKHVQEVLSCWHWNSPNRTRSVLSLSPNISPVPHFCRTIILTPQLSLIRSLRLAILFAAGYS